MLHNVLAVAVLGALTASQLSLPAAGAEPARLIAHEWGTFTSFSGSDGVPAHFSPNYTDLPAFVYTQAGPPNTKVRRLERDGAISMETPVVYFYSDQALKLSVKVSFPRGWLTEWYPFAANAPAGKATPGETMQWNVRLLPGETVKLPGNPKEKNNYFSARETDSVALQVEAKPSTDGDTGGGELHGGTLLQREKFLFYRGVATFPPPVAVKAIGGSNIRITNNAGGKVDGLVLLNVSGTSVGFKVLGSLEAQGEFTTALPAAAGDQAEIAPALVKSLTEAGLYEKEAKAMVNTWKSAWLGETGTRLLYLVPRAKTEELLPLTIEPKPSETTRVLVGRHDFLTPEQEAEADRLVKRHGARQISGTELDNELKKLGRFWMPAKQMAQKRLEATSTPR